MLNFLVSFLLSNSTAASNHMSLFFNQLPLDLDSLETNFRMYAELIPMTKQILMCSCHVFIYMDEYMRNKSGVLFPTFDKTHL